MKEHSAWICQSASSADVLQSEIWRTPLEIGRTLGVGPEMTNVTKSMRRWQLQDYLFSLLLWRQKARFKLYVHWNEPKTRHTHLEGRPLIARLVLAFRLPFQWNYEGGLEWRTFFYLHEEPQTEKSWYKIYTWCISPKDLHGDEGKSVSRKVFGHNQSSSQCFQVQPVTCSSFIVWRIFHRFL